MFSKFTYAEWKWNTEFELDEIEREKNKNKVKEYMQFVKLKFQKPIENDKHSLT